MRSAAFSPIMMAGALVFALTMLGMMLASATRRPLMPFTFRVGSTTAVGSETEPILQVPTGWYTVIADLLSSSMMYSSDSGGWGMLGSKTSPLRYLARAAQH